MNEKKCKSCGKIKSLSQYAKKGYTKNGIQRLRSSCNDCRSLTRKQRRIKKKAIPSVEFRETAPESEVYFVTWAQSATPAHSGLLRNMLAYAEHKGAEVIGVPGRYHNPTSIWSQEAQDHEWYDERITPYLTKARIDLLGAFTVFGDVSVTPTAARPLTSFHRFAGETGIIVGHPKYQQTVTPSASREYPRLMLTTGAITVDNYTDSKAGKIGEGHHVLGFAIVENGKDGVHVRHVNAMKDGSFIDLDNRVSNGEVKKASRPLALICGDVHVAYSDPKILNATLYGKDSIAQTLKPEKIVYHDLFHSAVRNHHTKDDFLYSYQQATGGLSNSVDREVWDAIAFLEKSPKFAQPIVVRGNHDEHLDRWLKEADFREDPVNAKFFIDSWSKALGLLQSHCKVLGGDFTAFEMWFKERSDRKDVKFLGRNDVYRIGGVFVHLHGDIGPNGSRGSLLSFSKLGIKVTTGHSHTPGVLEGAHCVGVLGRLYQDYNNGPSTWMHAHELIHSNGKRQMVYIDAVSGEWRGK